MKSFNELMIGENESRIILRIKDAVRGVLPDSNVILFGSRARGNAAADSDWDVLVLTQSVNHAIEQSIYKCLYCLLHK